MVDFRRLWILFRYYFKNSFNREVDSIRTLVKERFDVEPSNFVVIIYILVHQNAFLFLLLGVLLQYKDSVFFNVISVIILIFNLLLPITMSNNSRLNLESSTSYKPLLLSNLNTREVEIFKVLFELADFWLHNIYFEMLLVWVLLIKFSWLGLLLGVLWLLLVSVVFVINLTRGAIKERIKHGFGNVNLVDILFYQILYFFVLNILLGDINKLSLSDFMNIDILKVTIINHFRTVKLKLVNYFTDPTTYLTLIAVLGMYLLLRKFLQKPLNLLSDKTYEKTKKLYKSIALKDKDNPFLVRDLKRIENTSKEIKFNPFPTYLTNVCFTITVSFFVYKHDTSGIGPILSLDLILVASIVQVARDFFAAFPILNIASELKQINLLYSSSKYFAKDLVRSKLKLFMLLLSPLLLTNVIIKAVLFVVNFENMILLLPSLFLSFFIFYSISRMSLMWTVISPDYNWKDIFSIRIDDFDSKIIRDYMELPEKISRIPVGFAFFFVLVCDFKVNIRVMFLYYGIVFLYFLIFTLWLNPLKIGDQYV